MDASRITIKTLAKLAGVDVSTISRALNDSPRVKPETIKRIKDLANEVKYYPNTLAQGLVTSKTKTIGVVIPRIENAYYAEIFAGIEQVLAVKGYTLLLGISHYSKKQEAEVIELFLSRNVDGVILLSGINPGSVTVWKNASRAPIVLIDQDIYLHDVDSVACDIINGVGLAVDHLVSLGHQEIAYINDNVTSETRYNAFRKKMAGLGMKNEPHYVRSDFMYEKGGYEGAVELMKYENKPTAIFCANDYMAIGALKALEDIGLKVPEDISVVGFDDSYMLNYLLKSLTTVRQPKEELGRRAAMVLLERISEGAGNIMIEHILLKPELIVRNSTGSKK